MNRGALAGMTSGVSADVAETVASANMPGRSLPSGLETCTRTRAVRRVASTEGSMKETSPAKVSPGTASRASETAWPTASCGRSCS